MKRRRRSTVPRRTFLAACVLGALVAASSLSQSACVSQTTQVQRGQRYETGHPEYDALFTELHALQTEVMVAEQSDAEVRAPLLKALQLEPTAAPGAEMAAAKSVADRLKGNGIKLHLQLTPEAKLVVSRGSLAPDPASATAMEGFEAAAKTGLQISQKLETIPVRAEALKAKAAALKERVPTDFAKDTRIKRHQVAQELGAVDLVAVDLATRGRARAAQSSKYALDLAQAIETGATEAAQDAATPAKSAAPKGAKGGGRGGSPRPAASKPAGGGGSSPATPTPPPPPPPPPPAEPEDFEP